MAGANHHNDVYINNIKAFNINFAKYCYLHGLNTYELGKVRSTVKSLLINILYSVPCMLRDVVL